MPVYRIQLVVSTVNSLKDLRPRSMAFIKRLSGIEAAAAEALVRYFRVAYLAHIVDAYIVSRIEECARYRFADFFETDELKYLPQYQ